MSSTDFERMSIDQKCIYLMIKCNLNGNRLCSNSIHTSLGAGVCINSFDTHTFFECGCVYLVLITYINTYLVKGAVCVTFAPPFKVKVDNYSPHSENDGMSFGVTI